MSLSRSRTHRHRPKTDQVPIRELTPESFYRPASKLFHTQQLETDVDVSVINKKFLPVCSSSHQSAVVRVKTKEEESPGGSISQSVSR